MKRGKDTLRSDCPINFGVETFGDRWSLLILRDILFYGRKTYGEFLASDEHVATNILASRLVTLEQDGLIRRTPHMSDRRKDIFVPTQKTLDMIPMLLELVLWSAAHSTDVNVSEDVLRKIKADRNRVVTYVLDSLEGNKPPLLAE